MKRVCEEWIEKAESFLKEAFQSSPAMSADPAACAYRLEHSYRVANLGKQIAMQEGFDVTEMVIACLLHDISYSQDLDSPEKRQNHGRLSAQMARPFLESLGMPNERVQDICYGIAIHVDGAADFAGEATAFAESISDADNIDRFDAYRIYETLQFKHFHNCSLGEKKAVVASTLEKLHRFQNMKLATDTAQKLWQERISFCLAFYESLARQLSSSEKIL